MVNGGLNQSHLRDLKKSGLSDQTIQNCGFYSASQQEAAKLLGFDPGSSGLALPYPGTNSNGPPFIRVKPDSPFKVHGGRPAKYLSPKNSQNYLYIPIAYTKNHLLNREMPVVLTEGGKKALKGAQELPRFIVIALPGVWCFKNSKQSALIHDFRKFAWRGRDVFICYDSDVVQKREVQEAEKALAAQLDRLGANTYLCRLPSDGSSKVGLDDYLLNHSPATFVEQVLDRSLVWTPRGNVVIENAAEFVRKIIPHQEEIIGCGILPAKSTLMISAYSKMGKSIMALMMAICIASGKPFLVQFPVTRRRRVLYFQQEISERSMQDRLGKMLAYAKQEGFNPGSYLDIVNMAPVKLDSDDGIEVAMRIIRARRPDVVIWDPLYKLHSQDENKVTQMQRVLDKFDYLRNIFGITQIVVHHHGQPMKDSGREGFQLMRGSSTLGAFGDSYLTLTRYKKNERSNYQKLAFTLRNAEEPEGLVLYRNPEHLWYEVVAEADQGSKVSISDVVNTLTHLSSSAKRQELIQRLIEVSGASQRTADTVIGEAVKLGRIGKRLVGREVEFYLHE